MFKIFKTQKTTSAPTQTQSRVEKFEALSRKDKATKVAESAVIVGIGGAIAAGLTKAGARLGERAMDTTIDLVEAATLSIIELPRKISAKMETMKAEKEKREAMR